MATIPHDHARNVCRFGQMGQTCIFILLGGKGFECAKGTPAGDALRKRAAQRDMHAMSDNCSGPPDFKPPTDSN